MNFLLQQQERSLFYLKRIKFRGSGHPRNSNISQEFNFADQYKM